MLPRHYSLPLAGVICLVGLSLIDGVGDILAYLATAAIVVVTCVYRPHHPLHKYLAAGTVCFMVAHSLRYLDQGAPADLADGVGYLFVLGAVVSIVRSRVRRIELSAVLESIAFSATALMLLSFVNSIDASTSSRAVLQLLTICGATGIAISFLGRGANPFVFALVLAMISAAVVELLVGYLPEDRVNVLLAVPYLPVLYAVGLPLNKKRLSFSHVSAQRAFGARQQLLLSTLQLAPLLILAVSVLIQATSAIYVLLGLSGVATAALVARFRLLVNERDWANEQEKTLRQFGQSIISLSDPEDIHSLLTSTLHRLAGNIGRVGIVEKLENQSLEVIAEHGEIFSGRQGEPLQRVRRAHLQRLGRHDEVQSWFDGRLARGTQLATPLPQADNDNSTFLVCESSRMLPGDIEEHFNAAANQYRLALTANDLAAQVLQEKAINRFNTLAQDLNDLVVLVSPVNHTVEFVGPTIDRLLGQKPEYILGKNVTELVIAADRQLARNHLLAAQESGGISSKDVRLGLSGDTARWFEMSVRLLDEDDLNSVLVSFSNVHDRKMAALNLRNSEARFRALVQNSADVSILIGSGDTISYVSPNVKTVFGFESADLVGSSVAGILEDRSHDILRELMESASEGNTPTGEVIIRAPSIVGTPKLAEIFVSPSKLDEGEIYTVTLRDISERRQLEDALRTRALYDELTGLFNRSAFLHEVQTQIQRLQRRESVAIVAINIRNFKQINDSVGFKTGDRILSAVAARLQASLRGDDKLSRLSADEFAVSTVVESAAGASTVADKLYEAIHDQYDVDSRIHRLSASVGYTRTEDRMFKPAELVQQAVIAMHDSKHSGAGRPAMFTQSMQDEASERFEVAADIADALAQNQFHLVYQPLIRLNDSSVMGFEALLRWSHPDRGNLSPGLFIPLAEANGTIVELGRWVFATASTQLTKWKRKYPEFSDTSMSINLSAKQLDQDHELDQLRQLVEDAGVDLRSLIIELTESAMVEDADGFRDELDSLRASGVAVAIDDFGTGVNGLSHLRELPFDAIKIDKSYVDKLGVTSEGTLLVAQIIELARRMGAYTVAEGIETPEQAEMLANMGCDIGQGFYLARPMDEQQLVEWLQARNVGQLVNL